MKESNENIWYSGDWKDTMKDFPPYNGIKVVATSTYSTQTSPPSTQKFVSATLNVVDYTYDVNGVSSELTLSKTGVWYDILIPENDAVSPPQPNSNFTVIGIDNISLGKMRLEASSSGFFLNIKFRYGILTRTKEEIGYIMKFDSTLTEGQDPIQVG